MKAESASLPPVRDIVLIGGGHAHVQVLKSFGMHPLPGVRLTIVSSAYDSPYSGMLPGCVAGLYTSAEIHINLTALARFAGARFIQADVHGLNLESNEITFSARPSLSYDLVSLNTGALPQSPDENLVVVKPISRFLPKWEEAKARLVALGSAHVVVVGAGASGVELALAIRSVLSDVRISLVGSELLPGAPHRACRLIVRALTMRNIEYVRAEVASVENTSDGQHVLRLEPGKEILADEAFWVTGVQAPLWIKESGLDVDDAGFIRVNRNLQSVSHDDVFAAGDIVCLEGQGRPKSGVYAVRAGPYLSENLRRQVLQRPLKTYRAQRRHLTLIGLGDGRALATRGQWTSSGRMWWRLKDWIDRRFIRLFNALPNMPSNNLKVPDAFKADLPDQEMRCGGCGAKLAAEPLLRVLARLPVQKHPELVVGIGDDAAQMITASGSQLLTIDGFRAMVDDPYLFGRIVTHHSLNDIFAMGAVPVAVMTLVTIPLMAERMMEEDLYQLMRGVVDVLAQHKAVLVGGHSTEGLELSLGLSVTAQAPDKVLTKQGARPGDQLILTKPLGTGVVLAGAMNGKATAGAMDDVVTGLDQSNARAAEILVACGANALTDITGFGLIGHLSEVLRASNVGVVLEKDDIPTYQEALAMIGVVQSSLQGANELAFGDYTLRGRQSLADPKLRILADPQTSGGLLGSMPEQGVAMSLAELSSAGYRPAVIGTVTEDGYEIR